MRHLFILHSRPPSPPSPPSATSQQFGAAHDIASHLQQQQQQPTTNNNNNNNNHLSRASRLLATHTHTRTPAYTNLYQFTSNAQQIRARLLVATLWVGVWLDAPGARQRHKPYVRHRRPPPPSPSPSPSRSPGRLQIPNIMRPRGPAGQTFAFAGTNCMSSTHRAQHNLDRMRDCAEFAAALTSHFFSRPWAYSAWHYAHYEMRFTFKCNIRSQSTMLSSVKMHISIL